MNKIVKLLKALSDRNRLRIIAGLSEYDELCACQITELLQVSGATVSRHLTILSNAELVSSRKSGRWIYYRLQQATINRQILDWLKKEFNKTTEIVADQALLAKIVSAAPEDICRKQRGIQCCPNRVAPEGRYRSAGGTNKILFPKMTKLHKLESKKIKLLFLCTGNSCRSQMAEGWTRHLHSGLIEVFSAGLETHGLNSHAVKVMAEVGVDITKQKSQLLSEFDALEFDYVVTVCGHAHDNCPVFSGNAKVIHVGFSDPPKMAPNNASAEEKLNCFRHVRDEIKNYVKTLPKSLN